VIVLAIPCAVYTAYIFKQSKGRDLWQNPTLPVVLLVEAILAGAAALLLLRAVLSLSGGTFDAITLALTVSGLLMTASIASESLIRHESPYAKAAARTLTHGAYGRLYWSSLVLVLTAAGFGLAAYAATSIALGAAGGGVALVGLFAYEHAYIQAGQSVPQA
jgi:formate-dependent nitrite reductase membrane component NrfD